MSRVNSEYQKLTSELGDVVLKLDILNDKYGRLMHALKQLKFFEENVRSLATEATITPIKPKNETQES